MASKNKKIRIGFDLDGVIIDKPPFIPKRLIEWLVRSHKNRHLSYRYPKSAFERWVRWASHHPKLRPPIRKNVNLIKKLCKENKCDLYVISSRYSFLEGRTKEWFKKNKLNGSFKEIHINMKNLQPHTFKENKLNKLKIDVFVDDDPLLLKYLRRKLKKVKFYLAEKDLLKLKNDTV